MSFDSETLTIYLPGRPFPSLSVTGTGCDQMCEHCKGAHLRHMKDVSCGSAMSAAVDDIISSGGHGMLVSGGCDKRGSVPVMNVIDDIERAVRSGLKVNVHTGFLNEDDAERLVSAGVREFSVDVHQDPVIIKEVLHLDVSPDAYSEMIDIIVSAGGRPVPHLTAGFGTYDLLASAELVRDKGLNEITLLALVPVKGTITENSLITEDTIVEAARMLKGMGFEVTLGCMRPRFHRGLEIRCIDSGIKSIANPSRDTVAWAREKGMKIVEKHTCCCFTR
ncbi:MAG: hypothetical protein FWH44_05340 [Methanomassiliicoccaceae archaeon]|nr:hypothetical protein [Methanomassiliicoccaceae archaeon]MCL2143660.1 hypothetical protein [Methanomassiliicoccaceae archaeon]